MFFSYILGVCLRKVREVSEEVLSDIGAYHEIKRANPKHEPLKVKEVEVNNRRYVVCLNERQARKDAYDRELIFLAVHKSLIINNSVFRTV